MNIVETLKEERNRIEQRKEKIDDAIKALMELNGFNGKNRNLRTSSGWTPKMRQDAAARMRKMWKTGKIGRT